MTATEFRRLALKLPETIESAHMNQPDFRIGGKIFATLAYPDKNWGMVKLTPEQQEVFVADEPEAYVPVKGAWGKQGCTNVQLKAAKKATLELALKAAWSNAIAKTSNKKARTSQK